MPIQQNPELPLPSSSDKRPEQLDKQRIEKAGATEAQKNFRDGDPGQTEKSAKGGPKPEAPREMAPPGTPAQTKPSSVRSDEPDDTHSTAQAGPKSGDIGPDSHRK